MGALKYPVPSQCFWVDVDVGVMLAIIGDVIFALEYDVACRMEDSDEDVFDGGRHVIGGIVWFVVI